MRVVFKSVSVCLYSWFCLCVVGGNLLNVFPERALKLHVEPDAPLQGTFKGLAGFLCPQRVLPDEGETRVFVSF